MPSKSTTADRTSAAAEPAVLSLVLLGGFAWMVETLIERSYTSGFGNSTAFASAAIGQGIFAALLMLMTLQVVFLAPASTAGAISLEREKQTLELLITTPISSPAIVIGKLLSALVYLFLLIAASIPLMAVVFVFGGVAPEDVVSGYVVLLATALGLGSFGLLCSSLVKRTTAATAVTIFGVLAITVGTVFLLIFWLAMGTFDNNGNRVGGLFGQRPPAILGYVNPFIVMNELESGLKHHGLITSDEQRARFHALLNEVKREYEDIVKNEVQRAISADEDAIARLCANYIDNVKAYTQKERVKNRFTGQDEEPDERLMRSIEEKIDIPEGRKDDFRREIMNYIGALAVDGKKFDYKTNERLQKALELKLFEDQKDTIKLTSLVSNVVDRATQEKIDVVKSRLIRNYGYNEASATDVLNFVASIFARGQTKKS